MENIKHTKKSLNIQESQPKNKKTKKKERNATKTTPETYDFIWKNISPVNQARYGNPRILFKHIQNLQKALDAQEQTQTYTKTTNGHTNTTIEKYEINQRWS